MGELTVVEVTQDGFVAGNLHGQIMVGICPEIQLLLVAGSTRPTAYKAGRNGSVLVWFSSLVRLTTPFETQAQDEAKDKSSKPTSHGLPSIACVGIGFPSSK